jgi:hypothetical protein
MAFGSSDSSVKYVLQRSATKRITTSQMTKELYTSFSPSAVTHQSLPDKTRNYLYVCMQKLLEYNAGLKKSLESRIWVSHSGGFGEYGLQGYYIQSGKRKPKFRSNISPSSSGSKNKSSKEPEKQVAKHIIFFFKEPIYLQSVIIHSANGGKGEGRLVEECSVALLC